MSVARDDVREFLEAEVGAEAGLSDDHVRELERHLVREQGVITVSNVPERTGVYQRRLPLHRLHDVGQQRLLEQHRHCPRNPQVFGGDEAAVFPLANDDAPDPLAKILQVTR